MKKYLLLYFLLLIYNIANSQIDTLIWANYYGLETTKSNNCLLVESEKNTIVSFSTTNKGELLSTEITQAGKQQTSKTFKFSKSKINAVLRISDGYLLVGHRRKGLKYFPKLWLVDTDLNNLETINTNLSEKGTFNALTLTANDDEVMITGQLANKMCIYRYTPSSKKIEQFYIASEIEDRSEGKSIIKDNMQEFLVAGYQINQHFPRLTVWRIDRNGNKVKDNFYQSDTQNTIGQHLIQLSDTYIMVTGVAYTDTLTSNLFLRLPPNLSPIEKDKPLTSLSTNTSFKKYSLKTIQTHHEHLLTIGQNTIFGANTSDIWLSWFPKTNIDSLQALDSVYIESDYADRATDLLKLSNNNYVVATISGKKNRKKNIKLFYFRSEENPCQQNLKRVAKNNDFYFFPFKDKTPITTKGSYDFQGHLLTANPLDGAKISFTNQTISTKIIKSVKVKEVSTISGQYCYHLTTPLALRPESTNSIHLEILQKDKKYEQEIIEDYQLEKPNLHVITIGINLKLNYCKEDAKDIDSLFQTQEGKLFKRVYSYSKTETKDTDGDSIIDFIDDFCDNEPSEKIEKVTDKDITLLFISSHGDNRNTKEGENRFILPAIDFDSTNSSTYIDYKSDIIKNMERLPGKKVILIDACKSGSAKSTSTALTSSISRILDAPPGFITISSSDSNQVSHECGLEYKNGAFTFAIEEALSQVEARRAIDKNDDEVISIQELFQYLSKRVPEIAKTCTSTSAAQRPNLIAEKGNEDLGALPVFYIY